MKNPVRILLAVENREEFCELVILVKELLRLYQDQREFILFQTHPIFQLDDYTREYHSLFKNIFTAKNPVQTNFKRLSIWKKIWIILINTIILIRIHRQCKITHILSGVPLIFHRTLILFCPSLIHLAYIRGVLLHGRKATSVSDRFFFLTDKMNTILPIRFLNNYYADFLFTIGTVNKNALRERHIPESNIYLSGPLLLDQYTPVRQKPVSSSCKKELIYITQAYLWHLDSFGHREQLDSIRDLLHCIAKKYSGQLDIAIRIHPRDDRQLYEKLRQEYPVPVRIDTSPASEFLQGISGHKILVSGLSTLAFEWIYLGGSVAFLSTENLVKESLQVYKYLGISPYLQSEIMLQDILSERIPVWGDQIDRIFYRNSSSNLKYTADAIDKIFRNYEHK